MAELELDLSFKVNEELKTFYEEHISRLVIENESLKKVIKETKNSKSKNI